MKLIFSLRYFDKFFHFTLFNMDNSCVRSKNVRGTLIYATPTVTATYAKRWAKRTKSRVDFHSTRQIGTLAHLIDSSVMYNMLFTLWC